MSKYSPSAGVMRIIPHSTLDRLDLSYCSRLHRITRPKRQKMQKYVDKLLASSRVKRPDFGKGHWVAMWITQLFPNMRIWLQHLYHDLYTLPSTNYSIDPDNWPSLAPCLNEKMTFVQRPTGTMIPIGGTLVSVRHTPTPDLDTLQQVRISDKRIWMRIKDPNSERRHVSVQSQRILQLFKQWLANSSPYVLLRPKKGLARTCSGGRFCSRRQVWHRWIH